MAAEADGPFYQLGENLKVPLKLHEVNRQRLCARLKARGDVQPGSIVLLQGGETPRRYCTDTEIVFRQESFFHWAFGVREPDAYGAIEVDTGKAILFMPKLPQSYATWMGKLLTTDEFKENYACDECHFVPEIKETLEVKAPTEILTLSGRNTDSGSMTREATFDGIENFKVDNQKLHSEIVECRVIKTDMELEVMRFAAKMSSEAHKELMKRLQPGMYEYQIESIFKDYCYRLAGMRHQAYTSVCASGCNGAILHYGHAGAPNDKLIEDNEIMVFDLGGEYYCYSADITISIPSNGKYSDKQKVIYNAVLTANRAVFNAMKPGVNWVDMHKLAERKILEALRDAGLVKGEIDDMMAVRLCAIFMPHGLGHFLGIDVHDCGGYTVDMSRIDEPGLRSLRTARDLKENMVITIEPGCYFNDFLIDQALKNPAQAHMLVESEIAKYRGMGGVRIEDDVIVTATGAELMSVLPRTVQEVECFMAKKNK